MLESPARNAIREGSIEALIAQFDRNPFGVSRMIRQLRDQDPARFQESALQIISELPESSGVRFLATLLALSDPVLETIANPDVFDHVSARRILEVMRRIDSQAEAKLLRLISANPLKPLPPLMTDRILDLVDAVSEGPRLVPVLMQIFRSADPYLRARLALSIGRHHRNKDWLDDRMRDPDPRVRANTVEANWQQKDEQAANLFYAALRDPHHRVVGNGAVGLYYQGDSKSLQIFRELLSHREANCRAAGIWAIGHVLDTRFFGELAQIAAPLEKERDLMVRRSLVVAQGRLKRTLEIREEQPKLSLRLIKATRQPLAAPTDVGPPRFRHHLFIEVKNPEGTALQGCKVLQFHIFENEQAILDYAVQERTSYIKPGAYDIYFDSASEPTTVDGTATAMRHLKTLVVAEAASGELETCDFGEEQTKPVVEEVAVAEITKTWDAYKS